MSAPSTGRVSSHLGCTLAKLGIVDREQRRDDRTAHLIAGFPQFVDLYDEITPFTQTKQIELHRQTIIIRRDHATAAGALGDWQFIESLYLTLRSWGIGTRASVLVPIEQFGETLQDWTPAFEELDGLPIDDPDLDEVITADRLWRMISGMDIVKNNSKLVALSKTIHHVLPELLPPIDRAYTQKFFLWQPEEFQYQQERVFRSMWRHFVRIAAATEPASFVGSGWRTSRTKVIDNAIVAYVKELESNNPSPRPVTASPADPARLSETHSVRDLYDRLTEFELELELAGLKPNTVGTYVGRSKTFVDWLAGRYQPRGPNPSK